jgi:hypothetical protein
MASDTDSTLARLEQAALELNAARGESPWEPFTPRYEAALPAIQAAGYRHARTGEEGRLAGLLAAARQEERERCAPIRRAVELAFYALSGGTEEAATARHALRLALGTEYLRDGLKASQTATQDACRIVRQRAFEAWDAGALTREEWEAVGKVCRGWSIDLYDEEASGFCNLTKNCGSLPDHPTSLARAEGSHGGFAVTRTSPEFGCVQWEAREGAGDAMDR